MKLIYAQGFSKNEKLEWKPVVFNNIIQAFKLIFEAMNELDIKFENPENEVCILARADQNHQSTLRGSEPLSCQLTWTATEKHGSHHGGGRNKSP